MVVARRRWATGAIISVALCTLPHRSDYIIRPKTVWRIVSEDSRTMFESFLLIARPPQIVTATFFDEFSHLVASTVDSTGCSSI
jgi:hypothetical protein